MKTGDLVKYRLSGSHEHLKKEIGMIIAVYEIESFTAYSVMWPEGVEYQVKFDIERLK